MATAPFPNCPKCGRTLESAIKNRLDRCGKCGTPILDTVSDWQNAKAVAGMVQQAVQTEAVNEHGLTLSARRAVLQIEIERYTRSGYRVLSQTDTTAQLVKPKTFHRGLAIILFLCIVLPFIIYLLWYGGQKDQTVYLTVDERGKVQRR